MSTQKVYQNPCGKREQTEAISERSSYHLIALLSWAS
jgi:hypothetical protein